MKLMKVFLIVGGVLILGLGIKFLAKSIDPVASNIVDDVIAGKKIKQKEVATYVPDSSNYWRADNAREYKTPDVYYFKDSTSGVIYTHTGNDFKSVRKFNFDYKITGDLMMLNFNGITEYWVIFNKNTMVSDRYLSRNDKLRRIK